MTIETIDLESLAHCRRCPRMRRQFKKLRTVFPDYWNRPVPPTGPVDAPLLIVGLAPGKHGANKTGRAFTGDASGELLFGVLDQLGIGQRVRITNAVKCLPVANRPNAEEIGNCRRFLVEELTGQTTILALGVVAHRAVVAALNERLSIHPFRHGARHVIGERTVIDSYHCSRYNTQTGRLTEAMFQDVVRLAARHAKLVP